MRASAYIFDTCASISTTAPRRAFGSIADVTTNYNPTDAHTRILELSNCVAPHAGELRRGCQSRAVPMPRVVECSSVRLSNRIKGLRDCVLGDCRTPAPGTRARLGRAAL